MKPIQNYKMIKNLEQTRKNPMLSDNGRQPTSLRSLGAERMHKKINREGHKTLLN